MLRALTATGGVITSAGILLAAVFAVLGVLPLVVLAQLGAIIFVGVLLDTLVVRTVLVPALALTLGEKFWWPRKVTGTGPERSALATADRGRDPLGDVGVEHARDDEGGVQLLVAHRVGDRLGRAQQHVDR